MGRKKLAMRKIENPTSRQVTYSKRRDGIVKKANELAVLCDTDVALLMFSPNGKVTSYASNGRPEEVFLRFVDRPDELKGGPIWNEEYLSQRLKQLKNEGEMLEKIAVIEALEERLDKLNRRQREAQDKMRYYNPNVEKIDSVLEAGVYQQFLISALQRIELSKAKLLVDRNGLQNPESLEVPTVDMEDAASITDDSADTNRERKLPANELQNMGKLLSTGPHLSLGFIQAQKSWNASTSHNQAPAFM